MIGSLILATTLYAAPDVALALSNDTGTRLLAFGEVTNPVHLTKATCDGRVVDVSFIAQQPRGPKDSGRHTSDNFDQVPGTLYQVKGATIAHDASCLLGTASFFAVRAPVAVARGQTRCDDGTSALVARLGKRAVESCLQVGTFPRGRLALVTYARRSNELLIGLVLSTDKVAAVRRFPATFEEGAPSCWRADDGCTFNPADYHIPFVLTGAAGPMLFALWDGPEGQNIELLQPDGEDLEAAATGYRYWAPL